MGRQKKEDTKENKQKTVAKKSVSSNAGLDPMRMHSDAVVEYITSKKEDTSQAPIVKQVSETTNQVQTPVPTQPLQMPSVTQPLPVQPQNPVLQVSAQPYVSTPQATQADATKPKGPGRPKAYYEIKSKRTGLLLQPTVYSRLEIVAQQRGQSVNSLIEDLIKNFLSQIQ